MARLFLICYLLLMLLSPGNARTLKQKGFIFTIGNNGNGIGGYYAHRLSLSGQFEMEGTFYFVKENFPAVDIYGYPLPVQQKHLFFLPLRAGYQRILFSEQLAEGFHPLLAFIGGPNVYFDLAEKRKFSERWSKARIGLSYTIFIGVGTEFYTTPRNIMQVFFGYNLFTFRQELDAKKDYSTVCLKLQFGFR